MNTKRRTAKVLSLVAVASVAIAACGSDDDSTDTDEGTTEDTTADTTDAGEDTADAGVGDTDETTAPEGDGDAAAAGAGGPAARVAVEQVCGHKSGRVPRYATA